MVWLLNEMLRNQPNYDLYKGKCSIFFPSEQVLCVKSSNWKFGSKDLRTLCKFSVSPQLQFKHFCLYFTYAINLLRGFSVRHLVETIEAADSLDVLSYRANFSSPPLVQQSKQSKIMFAVFSTSNPNQDNFVTHQKLQKQGARAQRPMIYAGRIEGGIGSCGDWDHQ